ncbi:MAG TPA: isoaspartyl peptidase/L-asparaginase [Gammaproteobacteria bacterium]|nr:isoaspartyl peptidase/L-asparaginase [Gammaproteobacteria bacterium]
MIKRLIFLLAPLAPLAILPAGAAAHDIAIVMHGGAGTIERGDMTPQMEAKYRATMTRALKTGYAELKKGSPSLDACVAAIEVLENSPLFNAGKGAVFTHNGQVELDAAVMRGKDLRAGGVAAVQHVANPIALARLVMEKTPHVLLVGQGATDFAITQGIDLVPQSYFFTQRRWDALQKQLKEDRKKSRPEGIPGTEKNAFGTVGCAALDKGGNLAAGTSTGGLTNKRFGRVGDSPLIGDGVYADNETFAGSGTGVGEFYIRLNLLKDISDLMAYKGWSLEKAANYEVNEKLVKFAGKGTGGMIGLDRNGNIVMPFNTPGMYRGYINTDGKLVIRIYADE